MTQFRTYAAIGMREDLSDVIYNISPTDTPFMSTVGKTKATAVYHEWQTDSLAAAAANAAVEGADASTATLSPTTRVGNRTQISQKTIGVTGTLEAVDKAGRKSEKAYQLAKASSEIKRDMEFTFLSNTVQSNGTAGSTARVLGGLQTWLATNGDFGSGGSAGASGTTARTNGTNRTFTETDPSDAPTTIIGAADIYLSDFGSVSVVPNRFMVSGNSANEVAFVLDPEYAAVAYLRPFFTNELAKNGDSDRTQLIVEYTLEVRNEAAHGIIADLS